MRYKILLPSFMLLCFSCIQQESIERKIVETQTVKADLMTSMPGELLVVEDKVIWFDLNPDAFIHIEDEKTGESLAQIGTLGSGPEDFSAPVLSWYPNGSILVSDCFIEHAMIVRLDSINGMLPLENKGPMSALQCVGEEQFIQADPTKSRPFIFWDNGTESYFGSYPFKHNEITNAIDTFQGIYSYNPYNGCLLYSIPNLSYIALYQKKDNRFDEVWKKQLPDLDYHITNEGILKINEVTHPAPSTMALTKDYIVTIDRDKQTEEVQTENDSENRFIRNFSKAPQTLFVYDYDFNLKKILHTRIPMFRLAARGNDNTIYFIGVKGEFCIGRCVIQE